MNIKYEKLESEVKGDQFDNINPQYPFKKSGKKRQGFMRLITLISLSILVMSLIWLLISKIRKLSSVKKLNSELNINLKALKGKENDLQKQYEELNKEKEEIIGKNEQLNKVVQEYQIKNDQLQKESSEIAHEIKELEKELLLADEKGKGLNTENTEALNRIQILHEESKKYDKEIEDMKKQISSLEIQIDNKVSLHKIQSNIATTLDERNFIISLFQWSNLRFKLIFTKSDFGLDSEMFHKQCDDVEMSLVLLHIKLDTKHYKIGGFTSRKWAPNKGYDMFKSDKHAFLFNLSSEIKFNIKDIDKAIMCDYNNLIAFNTDLIINDCGIRSNFPTAYENNGNDKFTLIANEHIISVNNVVEMEVFEVIDIYNFI